MTLRESPSKRRTLFLASGIALAPGHSNSWCLSIAIWKQALKGLRARQGSRV